MPKDNVFGVDNDQYSYGGNVYQPCADDGIYQMLAPLAPGLHTIHFKGSMPATIAPYWAPFSVDVTYHITVQR